MNQATAFVLVSTTVHLTSVWSWADLPSCIGYNPANGHYYAAVFRPNKITWSNAKLQAEASGGYLATITDAAENQLIFSLCSDPDFWIVRTNPVRVLGPWLGGLQAPGAPEPASGWGWITGESFAFTNWHPGEPNQDGGVNEDAMQFYSLGSAPAPTWNDQDDPDAMLGFIIEWDIEPVLNVADLNCDLRVDSADLAVLLGDWGSRVSSADLDSDGVVGPPDLAILLGSWQP